VYRYIQSLCCVWFYLGPTYLGGPAREGVGPPGIYVVKFLS